MKTTLRLASSLVALSALLSALPAASAAPLSVERIIAADQANDEILLASNDDNGKLKRQSGGQDDNGGDFGSEGDSEGSEGGEGSEGSEGGDND